MAAAMLYSYKVTYFDPMLFLHVEFIETFHGPDTVEAAYYEDFHIESIVLEARIPA